ncbi:hypothetical protein N9L18_00175 [Candidatus Pacebacteria bacterium]|nr:hypothetical protein [Candidatus Paceibacterota bacterium]
MKKQSIKNLITLLRELQDGEEFQVRITVTKSVSVPLKPADVPEADRQKYLNTPIEDFLTHERFADSGVSPKVILTNIRKGPVSMIKSRSEDENPLVSELVTYSKKDLLVVRGVGKDAINGLEKVLAHHGLVLSVTDKSPIKKEGGLLFPVCH